METQKQQGQLRQWLQAFVLVGLGLYLLYDMLSGRITLYVNNIQFGWVPWLGTVLFLLIGGVQVFDLIQANRKQELQKSDEHQAHDHAPGEVCEHCDHDHAEHEHSSHAEHEHNHAPTWARLLLVSVPLMIGVFVPAKALGSAAIQTGGITTGLTSVGSGTSSELNIASTDRTVLDWVRAFGSASDLNTFAGQSADMIGFVYRDIRFDGKPQFLVARFVMSCCVADASAMGITVQTADADKWEADGWIRVTGKFAIQTVNGSAAPVLVADKIEPAAQPAHPYLYP